MSPTPPPYLHLVARKAGGWPLNGPPRKDGNRGGWRAAARTGTELWRSPAGRLSAPSCGVDCRSESHLAACMQAPVVCLTRVLPSRHAGRQSSMLSPSGPKPRLTKDNSAAPLGNSKRKDTNIAENLRPTRAQRPRGATVGWTLQSLGAHVHAAVGLGTPLDPSTAGFSRLWRRLQLRRPTLGQAPVLRRES